MLVSTVAFLRGQQGDILPVCDDPNTFLVTAELGVCLCSLETLVRY